MGRSRAAVLALAVALLLGACGQITGLSDDYTFDLEAGADGRPPTEGGIGPDGTAGDAMIDGGPRPDGEGGTVNCNETDQRLATTAMTGMRNDMCKACLAQQCCSPVGACTKDVAVCRVTLDCHLDCSEKGQPLMCFNTQCTNSSQPLFQAVRTCATQFCSGQCVL